MTTREKTALDALVSAQLLADFLCAFESALDSEPLLTIEQFHKKFTDDVSRKHRLSGFAGDRFWLLRLPGLTAMYLFAALVIPKETLHGLLSDDERERLSIIRNAVAHGGFKIAADSVAIFEDRDCAKPLRTLSNVDLVALNQRLVTVLGEALSKT